MASLKKWKYFWRHVRRNWKIKHRLIIRNESTHQENFSFLLSPRNIFVTVTLAAVFLIALTTVIIAFTPLRYYIPGYTTPDERREYEKTLAQLDSMQHQYANNEQYLENMRKLLNDAYIDTMGRAPEVTIAEVDTAGGGLMPSEEELALREESADLLATLSARQDNDAVTISQRANIQNLFLQPPTTGTIISSYNISQKQFGIDIANNAGTLITAAADGVIIATGYDATAGNFVIIQHHSNLITIYKHCQLVLKTHGSKVNIGEPIAKMGHSGITAKGNHLHFEVWHNGFPLNPLDYITLK